MLRFKQSEKKKAACCLSKMTALTPSGRRRYNTGNKILQTS